uniref:EVE domain-containing protein n=1 Tax=Thermofilum adornatum TaxID=1365176 RepID=A0A7C1GAI1_9CREN
MNYWTLVGTFRNWMIGILYGIWGVSKKAKSIWNKIQPGDRVVFYAVKTGILGTGTVECKFESKELLFPEEREEGELKWPFRLKIRVEKVFEDSKERPGNMLVTLSINELDSETFRVITGNP